MSTCPTICPTCGERLVCPCGPDAPTCARCVAFTPAIRVRSRFLHPTYEPEGNVVMNTRIPASEVAVGDNLFTPEGVYRVTQIDAWDLTNGKPVYPPYQQGGPSWPVLRILTEAKGYARFPHETVQVVVNNDVTLGAGGAS